MNITRSDDGSAMLPEPQGHKPAIARNKIVLPVPGSPTMSTRSPSGSLTCRSLNVVQPVGVAISSFSKVNLPPAGSMNSMRSSAAPSPSLVTVVSRKLAMRSSVARQSAMLLKLSQGLLHLHESADDHHKLA